MRPPVRQTGMGHEDEKEEKAVGTRTRSGVRKKRDGRLKTSRRLTEM